MIRKSHFVQLTLLMLLLFVLYQITSISITFDEFKSNFSNKNNSNATDVSDIELSNDKNSSANIVMITGDNGPVSSSIEEELYYLKKDYKVYKSIFALSEENLANTQVIILASDKMKDAYDLETIQNAMNKGINVIMAILPNKEELGREWKSLLGIKTMGDIHYQEGISIFSGFFLGDKQDYEKLKIKTRSIKVESTCKTYIAGLLTDKDTDSDEELSVMYEKVPDLLWRNVYKNGQIYVINGSFLETHNGIGIISAIFAQMYEDFIYPVINAKALFVNNAPYLSYENDEEMQKRYARNSQRFFLDIILPDIITLSMSTGNIPTFYGVASLNESANSRDELNTSVLPIVNTELKRIGAEMGISDYNKENLKNGKKVIDTMNLYKKELGDYKCSSLYVDKVDKTDNDSMISEVNKHTEIGSLVSSWDRGTSFSYNKGNILNIPAVTEGFSYGDENLFKLHSIATALGVVTHKIDINDMVYPQRKDEDWSNSFKDLASAVDTYWDGYKSLDSLNISSTERRVSRFLNIKPHMTKSKSSITISIDGFDEEAYFMLRTKKKVMGIDHGKVTEIQEGAYLIYADSANVKITLDEQSNKSRR